MTIGILENPTNDSKKLQKYKITNEDIKNYPELDLKKYLDEESESDSDDEMLYFYYDETFIVASSTSHDTDIVAIYKYYKENDEGFLDIFSDILIYQTISDISVLKHSDKVYILISTLFDEKECEITEIKNFISPILCYDAFIYNSLTPQNQYILSEEHFNKIDFKERNTLHFLKITNTSNKKESPKIFGLLEYGYFLSWGFDGIYSESLIKIPNDFIPCSFYIDAAKYENILFYSDFAIKLYKCDYKKNISLTMAEEFKYSEKISQAKLFNYKNEVIYIIGFENGKTIVQKNGECIFNDTKTFSSEISSVCCRYSPNTKTFYISYSSLSGKISIVALNSDFLVTRVKNIKKNANIIDSCFLNDEILLVQFEGGELYDIKIND